MRRVGIVFFCAITSIAGVAYAKGSKGAPPQHQAPNTPPQDPATKQFIEAARAQAPDHQESNFHLPSAAESLIAAWKASWDRAPMLKQRLESMWSTRVPIAERSALFRTLQLGTVAEPALHEGVAAFVRAHLPAVDAEHVLAPVAVVEPAHVAAPPQ